MELVKVVLGMPVCVRGRKECGGGGGEVEVGDSKS